MFAVQHESSTKDYDDRCRRDGPYAISKAERRVHRRAVCPSCRRYGPYAISKTQGRVHRRAVYSRCGPHCLSTNPQPPEFLQSIVSTFEGSFLILWKLPLNLL